MGQRLFLVDVEAFGKTPYRGTMTEFGVVDFETREWFHGHLWDFHPDPEIPAIPIPDRENPGYTTTTVFDRFLMTPNQRFHASSARDVFFTLRWWVNKAAGGDRPVFVSDNPAFDWMWMADGFDRSDVENPFGHSARRIGDLTAGLCGNWKNTSSWKRHRRTTHDHNPVNDSLGNAEALRAVLIKHGQIKETR